MIHLTVAVDAQGGIGKDNHLLCHLSADLKRFKKLTMGHPIIMGRKTFESLPGVLPGRPHIVVTGQDDYHVDSDHVTICHSIAEVMRKMDTNQDYFVVGGASLYAAFLPKADSLYVTEIDETFPADTFFPLFDKSNWHVVEAEHHIKGEQNPYAFTFVHYVRNK